MRELLTLRAEELVAKIVEMALNGDAGGLRICRDRLIATFKRKNTAIEIA